MDKGAHYFNCDFQVHTPRDLNWKGGDAVSETERNSYADELISACRKKGLDAIAITDHHDFVFFPYIKNASNREVDATGKPINKEDQIVVYPGLELTLTSPACQALLLLDADFPVEHLDSILTVLAITPSSPGESKTASVERISKSVVSDLEALYDLLNQQERIKGRFIVLPNVSDKGYGKLLRQGFTEFYRSMPCVGGYIDGPFSKLKPGNKSKIDGSNKEWGSKSVGVFQTSDNRIRNHVDLGTSSTWVKWSEPTAEALRQACLAKESRLAHVRPDLPSLFVMSLEVTNSKFLGAFKLEFNQQYNALIGGRGTGKSSVLEYLRWGLCDQFSQVDDKTSVSNRRKVLIDDTLEAFGGDVQVTFNLNGVCHVVKRSSSSKEVLLKIEDGNFFPATEEQIRNLLPIQAYSQKQLSDVGVKIEELRRFVELPIRQELQQVASDLRDVESKLRTGHEKLVRARDMAKEIAKSELEIVSLTQQIKTLRKSLKGLSEQDQATIEKKAIYDLEESILDELDSRLSTMQDTVAEIRSAIEIVDDEEDTEVDKNSAQDSEDLENPKLIKSITELYTSKFAEIAAKYASLVSLFSEDSLELLNNELTKWNALKEAFEAKYVEAKLKSKDNENQLSQISKIENRIATLRKVLLEEKQGLGSIGDPAKVFATQRKKWDNLHKRKLTLLKKQCTQFTRLSNNLINADATKSLDVQNLKNRIKTAVAGMNVREDKIEKISISIRDAKNPIKEWNDLLNEFDLLSQCSEECTDVLPSTPLLTTHGFKTPELQRIAYQLTASKWLELALSELRFNPQFTYCTNIKSKDYIEFSQASAGQQATALLTVLLNQDGAPLIIDQPEDDIDSRMIHDIIELVWKSKSKRQLVFASHNANFVVNGDAELVICFDYKSSSNHTSGKVKALGAIDRDEIKREITLVTEGGEKAFKLRKEKYGF